jgi:hypothetical protein
MNGVVETSLPGVRGDGAGRRLSLVPGGGVEWMPWAYRPVLDGCGLVVVDQVRLVALGADPATWPEAPASDLPPAAQPHPAG